MSSLCTNKIVFNKHNYIRACFTTRSSGGPSAALLDVCDALVWPLEYVRDLVVLTGIV
jgi:hypothetical protein